MIKKSILTILAFTTLVSAQSFSYTEYVRVSQAKPHYERTTERIPYQECYDERVRINRAYSSNQNAYNQQQQVVGAVLGGAVGGAIGHQIGKGKGNDIATVGGAILGTIVGGNMANQGASSPQRVYQEPQFQTQRKCVTKYRESRGVSRITGYENIAYYKGHKIVKYSDQRLSTIPVTVTISY